MTPDPPDDPIQRLVRENEDLRRRLEEAEDTIRALRSGEADAVFVDGDGAHQQVFTLEPAETAYRLLVEQIHGPAATLTCEGEILYCNHRFTVLLERPLAALLHKPLRDFASADSRPRLEALLHDAQQAEVAGEVTLERSSGEPAPAYLGVSVLQEGALGRCLLVTDLTEQRHYQELLRTQAALRASEERLDLAQRAGRIGVYQWTIATNAVSWSPVQEEIYGLRPGEFKGRFEDWVRLVHPDDRDARDAALRQAVADGEVDLEFRIRRADGETRWIASKGKVFYDSEGKPLRMLGVSRDVTRRKRDEEELREADRRKDEFLATLAHELRNPLAPIRNAVQILKAHGERRPELEWARGVLERQVGFMARLLDDLLDVSRIVRNKLELRKERVELSAVVDAALETSRPLIDSRRHALAVVLPVEPVYLDADPVRLGQVFANLLNNAAKFTEEGGRIQLTAERPSGEAEVAIVVRDSGIGLPTQAGSHIFEIFSQAAPSLLGSRGGLGIGLSLVKGLVELHEGTIEARSEGANRGSEFIVRLPVAPEVSAPKPESGPQDDEQELPPGPRRRILIVDDNRDSADSLAMLLEILGNEVGTAYDGEQAVEAAAALRPEVILLDVGMPKLNGYEACRRIREQPWGRDMSLIALTGWGKAEDRRRTQEAGFDRHLVKPVDAATLKRVLASLERDPDGEPTG